MSPKIKNSLIFVGIGTAFFLIYVFFIKGSGKETPTLVSSSEFLVQTTSSTLEQNSSFTGEFLSSLLNVTHIKLNDAILFDDAFISLRDSSIVLVPDGDEGRPNPFAPIGAENFTPPPPITPPTPPASPKTSGKIPATSTNLIITPVTPKTP